MYKGREEMQIVTNESVFPVKRKRNIRADLHNFVKLHFN